ncbi:MAG TPA: APC family permease [Solirubrobacteraceae bacterium]|nr:APC family permease [Solirubrobacteraceae bacterium]
MGATQSQQQELRLDAETLDRKLGFLGLLWSSEGSIIGSGWLFGALTTVTLAGPSAIIGWVIATVIVIILALIHAELGGLFPVTGGTARFPHYAFGSLAGGAFGWMSYLQAASVAPIEVLAAVQYLSSAHWASSFYNGTNGTLHGAGWAVAIGLEFVFTAINLIGIAWFARINSGVTWWKVAIPVLTIIIFLIGHFHGSNFSAGGGFFVHGAAIKSILLAIPNGGIVFSLLGFEQAVQLGGEAANPKRDLPRAVICSILLGGAIYILVQVAFIAALKPSLLATAHGWTGLATPGHSTALAALNSAPFYEVAKLAGLSWLALLLRIDAVVSPSGTGMIYLTSSSRISYGLSRNGYIPSVFEDVSKSRVPVFSVVFAALIGLLFLLPFPSWGKLVGIVTDASVLMYAAAPLSLGALRLSKPNLERPYQIPAAPILAPIAFVCADWIVYWAGWGAYTTLVVAMLIGYALYWISAQFKLNPNKPAYDWEAAPWLLAYVLGTLVISYFGGFGAGGIIGSIGVFKHVLDHGGNNDLGLWGGLAASAAWSLVIYYWAMNSRLPESKVDEYVQDVYPSAEAAAH